VAYLLEQENVNRNLQDFFTQAPIPMLILLGPQHRFALINPSYERFFGHQKVLGKTICEVFTQDEAGNYIKLLDDVYRTGVPYQGNEMPLSLPDENGVVQKRFLNVSYHPFREVDGTIKGIIAIYQDATEQVVARQKAEIERENFRNLFKQTPKIVCILRGPRHIFEFVNEGFIRAIGFDATGLTVREALPESDELHGILEKVYRTGKTAELRETPIKTDGLRYFNLTYAARRDEDGRIDGVMVLGAEVTDQVQAREELKRAVRSRDEFLSIASHELKTPMTSLKMNIQLMERRLNAHSLADSLSYYCSRSNLQINQLTRLIDDLLDISKIQAGKLTYDFERTDFLDLYHELIERFSDQLQSNGMQICRDIEKSLVGIWDKARLEQVLINLISNAIKYAPGSSIKISAKRVQRNAVISVRDFGPGIPKNKQELIFDRFERIGDSKNVSGLGLGLYISRQIVNGHGGTIELDSSVSDGACFVVTIPLDPRSVHSLNEARG
jgi:PAS domain S-box-containing protein